MFFLGYYSLLLCSPYVAFYVLVGLLWRYIALIVTSVSFISLCGQKFGLIVQYILVQTGQKSIIWSMEISLNIGIQNVSFEIDNSTERKVRISRAEMYVVQVEKILVQIITARE